MAQLKLVAAVLSIAALLFALFSASSQTGPSSYIHSIGLAQGETRYLTVKGDKVEGRTVDYTLIQRETGIGIVHNWNIACEVGEAGYGDDCFPVISPVSLCGKHVPELKVTALADELFDISCDLDLHVRADKNIKEGMASQALVDNKLAALKSQWSVLSDMDCGHYFTGYTNTTNENLPESLCVPERKVTKEWLCDHIAGFELGVALVVLAGDRLEIEGQCEKELTDAELALSCTKGFSLNKEGMCQKLAPES
ncbi:MAG: hypothetical protein GJ680_07530 [Alteromonadaceae bacterium]|nr:hypothetical protein [Alteromonadaceae bacterium]